MGTLGESQANVRDFGAKGDYVVNTTASCSGTTLTTTDSPFVAADVGKVVTIPGAGTSGANGIAHRTTIATFTDANNVELTATCPVTTGAATKISLNDSTPTYKWDPIEGQYGAHFVVDGKFGIKFLL